VTPNTGNFSSCAFASAGILHKTHQPQGELQAHTSGIGQGRRWPISCEWQSVTRIRNQL
jgi:hypothetical protein